MEPVPHRARVLPYVDVPLQHASDRVLRAMRRGIRVDRQRRLVEKLIGQRQALLVDCAAPDLAVGRLRSQAPEIDGQVGARAPSASG